MLCQISGESEKSTISRCNAGSSRAGGDRTHDRGIMTWEQSVGLVRWRRIGLQIPELFVRRCRIGPVVSDWYVG